MLWVGSLGWDWAFRCGTTSDTLAWYIVIRLRRLSFQLKLILLGYLIVLTDNSIPNYHMQSRFAHALALEKPNAIRIS